MPISIDILQSLCSTPTAPFAEGQVVAYVEQFAKKRRLRLSRDAVGNLLLELPQSKLKNLKAKNRWVFTAHMDHPGFIAEAMADGKILHAAFRGGVRSEYLAGAKVRFFDAGREIIGQVIDVSERGTDRAGYPTGATIRVRQPVASGSPGMFDVGEGRTRGNRFSCRCCDDLAGAAAALTMLETLNRQAPKAPVAVLLTRAEEEGFIGAIAAARQPKLLKKSDRLIAIECSAMQSYAPQGEGCIIRVGDRTSIFHSALTYFLTQQAEALAKKDKSFRYQRTLMPGGTCEATVYDLYGFTAASICVPLGNYHNMDPAKKKPGPEFIDLNDWRSMVKLFIQIARTGQDFDPANPALRQRVEGRYEKLKHLL